MTYSAARAILVRFSRHPPFNRTKGPAAQQSQTAMYATKNAVSDLKVTKARARAWGGGGVGQGKAVTEGTRSDLSCTWIEFYEQ